MCTIEKLFVTNPYLAKIKELTNCGIRSASRYFPDILQIENGRVEICHQTILGGETRREQHHDLDLLTTSNKHPLFTPTKKLKAASHGDWALRVGAVHKESFASRVEFDEAFCPAASRCTGNFNNLQNFWQLFCKDFPENSAVPQPESTFPIKRCSIREALKAVGVTLRVDIPYLAKEGPETLRTKIQERLGWNNFNSKNEIKRLERTFFYKAMEEMFGKSSYAENDEEKEDIEIFDEASKWYGKPAKEYIIYDFSLLSFDGNTRMATCRKGKHFLYFRFDTS